MKHALRGLWREIDVWLFPKNLERSLYKTYHAEYAALVGRWLRNFVIIGTIDIVILGSVLYFLHDL